MASLSTGDSGVMLAVADAMSIQPELRKTKSVKPSVRLKSIGVVSALLLTCTQLNAAATAIAEPSRPAKLSVETPLMQPIGDIEAAARDFIYTMQERQDVEVSVNSLDSRLRLSRCAEPLHANWSPGSRTLGRVTVLVECDAPKPWRLHIQATVVVEDYVWTLARGVRRGDVLDESLLVRKKVRLGEQRMVQGQAVMTLAGVIGQTFTRPVNAGMVLNDHMVKPADLVRKGETVTLKHSGPGVQLQVKGVAMTAGVLQQRVRVRNANSKKIVEGVVTGRGQVETLK